MRTCTASAASACNSLLPTKSTTSNDTCDVERCTCPPGLPRKYSLAGQLGLWCRRRAGGVHAGSGWPGVVLGRRCRSVRAHQDLLQDRVIIDAVHHGNAGIVHLACRRAAFAHLESETSADAAREEQALLVALFAWKRRLDASGRAPRRRSHLRCAIADQQCWPVLALTGRGLLAKCLEQWHVVEASLS